jgi:PAS domain S-box-containing protein
VGSGKEYDGNRENLETLVRLTQQLNEKNCFIRAQTAELFDQQRSLALAESRLVMLLDMTPLGMMITLNRVITYANRRMEELTGYQRSEMIGQSTRILYTSDEDWVKAGTLQHVSADTKFSTSLRKKDGSQSPCMVRMTRIVESNPDLGDEFVVTVYLEKDIKQ